MSRNTTLRPLVEAVQADLRHLSSEIGRLDALAAEAFGLNRTDLRCLDLLSRGGPQTATELARALGFTTGGTTAVIDRLEQAGYARRRADPADRRRVIVEPTDLLAQRDAEIFGRLIQSTEELLSSYSDTDLATIRDFLTRSRATIAAHVEALLQPAQQPRSSSRRRTGGT